MRESVLTIPEKIIVQISTLCVKSHVLFFQVWLFLFHI